MEKKKIAQTSECLEIESQWLEKDEAFVTSWHQWEGSRSLREEDDAAIESALNLSPKTISALGEAFRLGLSRHTGWQVSAHSEAKALQDAAKIFRRGVLTDLDVTSAKKSVLGQANYQIQIFHSNYMPNFDLSDPNTFCIIDENVWKLWQNELGEVTNLQVCSASEGHKNLKTLALLCTNWKKHQAASHWVIIGGGVVCDISAFAASLMGCPFTLVPTTLLAMADASVGGKTGVNFPPYGKNQIGAFAYPRSVKVWPFWLKTLAHDELLAGGAECYKHALLVNDTSLQAQIAKSLKTIDLTKLSSLLKSVISIKAQVISHDPLEKGERATLNFGHTLAHALETVSLEHNGSLTHGLAVAYGMTLALRLSSAVNGYPQKLSQTIGDELKSLFGLSKESLRQRLNVDDIDTGDVEQRLCALLAQDKKNKEGASRARWILLDKNARPFKDGRGVFGQVIGNHIFLDHWRDFLNYLSS